MLLLQDGAFKLASGEVATAAREFAVPEQQLCPESASAIPARAREPAAGAGCKSGRKPKGRSTARKRNLTEAIKLNPNFEPAVLALVRAKDQKGQSRPRRSICCCRSSSKNRRMRKPYYLLATAYLAQRNATEAIAIYQRMTELFPDFAGAPLSPGHDSIGAGQPGRRLRELREGDRDRSQIICRRPRDLSISISRTSRRPRRQVASRPTSRRTRIRPRPWQSAPRSVSRSRIVPTPRRTSSKSIELDPKLEGSYLLLAQLYLATNRAQQAVDKLQEFTKDNTSVPALMQLADDPARSEAFSGGPRRLREGGQRGAKCRAGAQQSRRSLCRAVWTDRQGL